METKKSPIIAALVVAVLAVAVLAACASQGEMDSTTSQPGGSRALQEEPAAGVPASGYSEDAFAAGGGTGDADTTAGGDGAASPLPDLLDRKIIRNATVSLEVEGVLSAVQRVEAIAEGAGGFVSASSVFVDEPPEPVEGDTPQERTRTASVTIRVPASAYVSVLGQLREMGDELLSETSTTSDVTEEFTDLEARLRNLEATEAQYLTLLQKAETVDDILTVQDRIDSVRLQIETTQGRINALNDLTDLATIVVQLRPPAVLVDEPSQQSWAQEAWDDAWDGSQEVLEALGTTAIVAGVVFVWIAVPGLAILIGWRLLWPRHRGGPAGGSGTTI